MGAVYRARHRELGAIRAVKVMTGRLSSSRLARFEREAHNLARIHDPNVVTVHETVCEAERVYIAMELVEGRSLDRVVHERRLSLPEALRIVTRVCSGVAALHAAGIVHRDLKPANVVIASDGRPVVIDLGLALCPDRDERLTASGATLGTLGYMAPEQLHGGRGSPQADVFALGVILLELTTGTRWIADDSGPQEALVVIANGKLPVPSKQDPSLPLALDRVVAAACALDPSQRPADAGVLLTELQTLQAAPGSTPARSRRLGLVVACSLVAVAAGLLLSDAKPRTLEAAPAPAPAPAPVAAASLSPAQARPGRMARRALKEHQDPRQLHAACLLWLERFTGHSLQAEVEELARGAQLAFPLKSLTFPKPREPNSAYQAKAFWIGESQAVLWIERGSLLCLWDVERGRALQRWTFPNMQCVVPAPDGQSFAIGTGMGVLHFGLAALGELGRHPHPGFRVAWAPDGSELLCAGYGGKLVRSSVPGYEPLLEFGDAGLPVRALAYVPGRPWVLVGRGESMNEASSGRSAIQLWDSERGVLLSEINVHGTPHFITVAPDRGSCFVGTSTSVLARIELQGDELTALQYLVGNNIPGAESTLGGFGRSKRAHGASVRGLVFRAGRFYTVAGAFDKSDHSIRVWDAQTLSEIRRIELPHPGFSIELSAGGRLLVACGVGQAHVFTLEE